MHVRFNPEEDDYYTALYSQTQATFNAFVTQGTVVNNYAHIFDLLIRLRQAVDHPWLVEYSATRMLSLEQQNESDDKATEGTESVSASGASAVAAAASVCGICAEECYADATQSVRAACGHLFCKGCLQDLMSTAMDGGKLLCPSCPAHMPKALSVDLTQLEEPEERLDIGSEGGGSPRSITGASLPPREGDGGGENAMGTKQVEPIVKKVAVAPAGGNISYQAEEQRMLSRKGILKRISEVDPCVLILKMMILYET